MTQPAQNSAEISIVVLGGINMDLVTVAPRFQEARETVVGSRFLTYPGGKGANQAVAAARMGAGAAMVGRVGDDIFGPQLRDSLASSGVDVSGVAVEQGANSGIAVVNIDASSQNRIVQVLGANELCGEPEGKRVMEALRGASTLLLQLEVSFDLALSVARQAAAQGKAAILDPGPARPLPPELYPCCRVITSNETEAQALVGFPVADVTSAARAAGVLLERGVEIAIIKLGAQGAYYATGREASTSLPYRSRPWIRWPRGTPLTARWRHPWPAVTTFGAQDFMRLKEDVERLPR